MATAPTSVSNDAASATTLARSPANSTAAEPTSGISPRTVTQGKPVEDVMSAHPHQEERRGDGESPDEHGQRIRTREPRLYATQPCAGPADQRGEPVDATVDATSVEVDERAGEVGPRPHEHVLVEGVAIKRATGCPRDRRDVERLLDGHRLAGDEPPGGGHATGDDEQGHQGQHEWCDGVRSDFDALADRRGQE